jgi:hypothetical protein
MSYANLELRKKTAREYYSKNPQVAKNNQEKKRQRNRDIIHEHCGYECCKCGSKKNLEYDHINPCLLTSKKNGLIDLYLIVDLLIGHYLFKMMKTRRVSKSTGRDPLRPEKS